MKLIVNGETAQIPAGGGAGASIPTGGIIMWSGEDVPDGWALCDGTNGTPDLRGRFVLGQSEAHALGSTGGSEEVTLTMDQMPEHSHIFRGFGAALMIANSTGNYAAVNLNMNSIKNTDTSGANMPHNNMPPYYTLAYIMKL